MTGSLLVDLNKKTSIISLLSTNPVSRHFMSGVDSVIPKKILRERQYYLQIPALNELI